MGVTALPDDAVAVAAEWESGCWLGRRSSPLHRTPGKEDTWGAGGGGCRQRRHQEQGCLLTVVVLLPGANLQKLSSVTHGTAGRHPQGPTIGRRIIAWGWRGGASRQCWEGSGVSGAGEGVYAGVGGWGVGRGRGGVWGLD